MKYIIGIFLVTLALYYMFQYSPVVGILGLIILVGYALDDIFG